MAASVQVDLHDLENEMERLASNHERAVERGLDRVATIGLQAKTRQVQKTYSRKIRLLKSGKAAWQRLGNWLKGQRILKVSSTERHIVTEGPAEEYEEYMANRRTGPDGINRSNAATENAARIIEPQVGPAFSQEYANAQRLNRD